MKRRLLPALLIVIIAALGLTWLATRDSPGDDSRTQVDTSVTPESTPAAAGSATPGSTTPAGQPSPPPEPPPASAFQWTFDGTPGSPGAFAEHADYMDFDVQVHSRDQFSWGDDALPSASYDHGEDCAGSPDSRSFPQHTNTSYEGAVFICNNHLMTANAGSGYGAVVLTPNRYLDLSEGTTTVSLRMSTFRQSDRDWVEFSFSPWAGNNTIPCHFCPDLQGNPVQSLMLNMSQEKLPDGRTGTGFALYVNGQLSSGICPCYESVLEPDKARRDLIEIEVSDTHLIMRMPEYDLTLLDESFASLGWDRAIFQIIHHSYNPGKGSAMHAESAGPTTWHWDDISLSPSTPFEIVKSDKRALLRKGPGDLGSVNFAAPAPEDAYLRFSAFANPDVSFDGGATWVHAEPQPSTRKQIATDGYFIPIPAGVQEVSFRANCVDWYCDEMHVKDTAIWAQTGGEPAASSAPVGASEPNATPEATVPPATASPAPRTTGSQGMVIPATIAPPTTGSAGLSSFLCTLKPASAPSIE